MMKRMTMMALVMVSLAACGGPKGKDNPVTGTQPDGTPKWVHRGSGAFDTDSGAKALFGVGIASGIRDEAMARKASDNRARGEIALLRKTYVSSMMKDYQRATTSGDYQASSEEQDIVNVQKTMSEASISGIEIRDHWWNPQSGAVYALAVLDLTNVLEKVEQAKELQPRTKAHVRANADRAFRDLNREMRLLRRSGK